MKSGLQIMVKPTGLVFEAGTDNLRPRFFLIVGAILFAETSYIYRKSFISLGRTQVRGKKLYSFG